MAISPIADGDLSARTKMNAAIAKANEVDGKAATTVTDTHNTRLGNHDTALATAASRLDGHDTALAGKASQAALDAQTALIAAKASQAQMDAQIARIDDRASLNYAELNIARLDRRIDNRATKTQLDLAESNIRSRATKSDLKESVALIESLVDTRASAAALSVEAAIRAGGDADTKRALGGQHPGWRPGENPEAWTYALDGSPFDVPSFDSVGPTSIPGRGTVERVVSGNSGSALLVAGGGVVAPSAVWRVEPGHVYRARFAFRRNVDPVDPANDGVELGLRWMVADKSGIESTVVSQILDLLVASGRKDLSFTFSLTGGENVDFVAPAGAMYVRPFIEFFGDAPTLAEVVELSDVSAASVWAPDVADLQAQISAALAGTDYNELANKPFIPSTALQVGAASIAQIEAALDEIDILKRGRGLDAALFGFLPGIENMAGNAAALRAAMIAAAAADTYVRFSRGADNYHMSVVGLDSDYFSIRNANGFGVYGDDATIILHWNAALPSNIPTRLFMWVDILNGFFVKTKFDFDPFISTQGVITEVVGSTITFTMDEGMEPAFADADFLVVFSEDRKDVLSRNVHVAGQNHLVEDLGEGSYRVYLSTGAVSTFFPDDFIPVPGQVISAVCRKRTMDCFYTVRCDNFVLEDLHFKSFTHRMLVGGDCENMRGRRLRVASDDGRLIALCAGMINFSHARGDFDFSDIYGDGMGDDGISCHTSDIEVTAGEAGEYAFEGTFTRGDGVAGANVPWPRVGDVMAVQPPGVVGDYLAKVINVSTPLDVTTAQTLTVTLDTPFPLDFDRTTWGIYNQSLTGVQKYNNVEISRGTARQIIWCSDKGSIAGLRGGGMYGSSLIAANFSDGGLVGFRGGLRMSDFDLDDVCTSTSAGSLISNSAICLFVGESYDNEVPVSAPTGWPACTLSNAKIKSRNGGISAVGVDLVLLGAVDFYECGANRDTEDVADYNADVFAQQAAIYGGNMVNNRNAVRAELKGAGGRFLANQMKTDDGVVPLAEYTPLGKLLHEVTLSAAVTYLELGLSQMPDLADYDTIAIEMSNVAHDGGGPLDLRIQLLSDSDVVGADYVNTQGGTVFSSWLVTKDAVPNTPYMIDLVIQNFRAGKGRISGESVREANSAAIPVGVAGRRTVETACNGFRFRSPSSQIKIGTTVTVRGWKIGN